MLIQCSVVAGCCREEPAFHFIEHSGNQHESISMVRRYILIADDALRHRLSCADNGRGGPANSSKQYRRFLIILQTLSQQPRSNSLFRGPHISHQERASQGFARLNCCEMLCDHGTLAGGAQLSQTSVEIRHIRAPAAASSAWSIDVGPGERLSTMSRPLFRIEVFENCEPVRVLGIQAHWWGDWELCLGGCVSCPKAKTRLSKGI